MHVKAKELAICGLMLALTIICIMLGSVIETNTLFLLAAASYAVGIVNREYGIGRASVFWVAALLLGMFLTPNKFYVISYGAMGLYILLTEVLWNLVGRMSPGIGQRRLLLIGKYVIFNIIYISMIFLMGDIVITHGHNHTMSYWTLLGLILVGQVAIWLYDKAYQYFQGELWGKIRRYLI